MLCSKEWHIFKIPVPLKLFVKAPFEAEVENMKLAAIGSFKGTGSRVRRFKQKQIQTGSCYVQAKGARTKVLCSKNVYSCGLRRVVRLYTINSSSGNFLKFSCIIWVSNFFEYYCYWIFKVSFDFNLISIPSVWV